MLKILKRLAGYMRARLSNEWGFADTSGDNATLDQAGGPSQLAHGLKDARVKANLESFPLSSSLENGDTLDLGPDLPENARVLAIIIHVDTAQSSLTISLGDDDTADRYVSSGDTSLQNVGTYVFSGQNYKVGQATGDDRIKITTGGANATAGQLEAAILYTWD